MAGEMEEPISLEESSLQTGSVSFGRFESEILSWERKSTFSQNRYLEEVEKYSMPGSVTQKKAYFEEHFKKKKNVPCQDSECQSGMEGQINEDDNPDDTNHMQDIDHDNEEIHFTHCYENTVSSDDLCQASEGPNRMECQKDVNDNPDTNCMQEVDHDNEEIHLTHDYENTVSSDDHGGPEASDIEKKCNGSSSHYSKIDPFIISTISGEDGEVEPGEIHKTHSECDNQHTEPEVVERTKPIDEAESADRLRDGGNHLPKSQMTANDCVAGTKKLQKPKLKVSTQVLNKRTSGTSKDYEKDTKKVETGSMKTRKEKQLPQKAIQNASSQFKTVRAEDPKSKVAKPVQENRSDKDQKAKKAGNTAQPLGFEKTGLKSQHSASRPKHSTAKPEVKPSAAVFSLKSNERAEKRKEFDTKLEEKLHAKEAEIHQIQAKTQEEKEAKFKQFRRSLNFKATPMPSFYNGAVSQGSETKKNVASPAKVTIGRSKSTSPGSNTRPPAFPTALPTVAAKSSTKPSTTTKKQTGKRLDAVGIDDRQKCKDANIQKQHRLQCSRVRTMKGKNNESAETHLCQ